MYGCVVTTDSDGRQGQGEDEKGRYAQYDEMNGMRFRFLAPELLVRFFQLSSIINSLGW